MTRDQIRGWILAVAFVGAVVTHNTIRIWRHPPAELAIQMQIGATSREANLLARSTTDVSINFDKGHGFSESKNVVRAVNPSEKTQQIFLPVPTGTIHAIRFNPLAVPGTVQISSFIIQRPRPNQLLRRFELSQFVAGNHVTSLVTPDSTLKVTVAESSASDGQLSLSCDPPLAIHYSAKQIFSGRFFRINAIWLFVGVALFLANRFRRRWQPHLLRIVLPIDKTFAAWSRRFGRSPLLPLDRTALWFYTLCLVFFLTMATAGFHGSSISIYGSNNGYGPRKNHPLVGTPKGTRVDEWNYHTPAILNQLLRRDRLAADSSQFGPDKAALFGNIPTTHWSEWFRPQFWTFHFLPLTIAYAFYWQFKGLLLITGTFSLLLLLTRSSFAAVVGALWYFFSTYTQWCYSWPSLLPEMVGLFGWVVCLGAYLTIGQSRWRLALAAVLCSIFVVDFALCAYPPHQFPLVILGLILSAWWLWTKRDLILRRETWLARSLAVTGFALLTAVALGLFYLDVRVGFDELANTVYPGRRSIGGGYATTAQMLSHLMDFWKTERRFPVPLSNICEAVGYLWLAPATLLLSRFPQKTDNNNFVNKFLWLALLILAAWILLPIPAAIGKVLLLDKVTANRCLPTLGLINIAIVVMAANKMRTEQGPTHWKEEIVPCIGLLILVLGLLACMNAIYGHHFTSFEVATAALYTALLFFFLRNRWRRMLTAALLLPAILTTALVNPLDRGFDVTLKSSLSTAIKQQPQLKDGRWLVFSSWITLSGFFSACGLNLANGLKIIPNLDELARFDPEKKYQSVINQSCYLVVQMGEKIGVSEFESPRVGVVFWKVNPLDPKLKEIGIKYLAFDYLPDSFIREKLKVILEDTSSGIWAYELP